MNGRYEFVNGLILGIAEPIFDVMKTISRIVILAALLCGVLSSCTYKEKCAAYGDVELSQDAEPQD